MTAPLSGLRLAVLIFKVTGPVGPIFGWTICSLEEGLRIKVSKVDIVI